MTEFNFSNYFTYKDEVSRTISWGHRFLFLNIFLTLFLGCAYLYNTTTPSSGLGIAYLILSWLGHFSFLVFIIYLVVFFPLAFIGSLRVYRVLSVILATILLLVLTIDIKLYQSIKVHLSISYFDLFFEQEGFSTGLNFNYLYFAIPILVSLEIFFSKLSWKHIYTRKNQKVSFLITSVFLLSFFSAHILHIWANAYMYSPITANRTLFPAYYPMTANSFLKEHGWIKEININNKENSLKDGTPKANYPLAIINTQPMDKPTNIVILLVNGLNYTNMNEQFTPNIYEFAHNNHLFTNHYIGSNSTTNNCFELLYGLPSQYLPILQAGKISPIITSEMLQQDYAIKAFITGELSASEKELTKISSLRKKQVLTYTNDIDTVKHALQWIDKWSERPQLTIVSLNDANSLNYPNSSLLPFKDSVGKLSHQSLDYTDETVELVLNNHYNALFSDDLLIKSILDKLENKLNDTVIILTSLNTFSSQAYISSSENYERSNHHVPLVLSWKDKSFANFNAITTHQDIAPTIAQEILGITTNIEDYSTGENLVNTHDRKWLLSGSINEIQIITKSQTTIFDKHGNAITYADSDTDNVTQPNMVMLIKAIKLLNKFKEK